MRFFAGRFLPVILFCLFAHAAFAAEVRATAVFAGGNFWAMQKVFDSVPGVTNTVAGYTGGILAHPSYKQVAKGDTGHRLAVRVTFDPSRITYEQLLAVYWRNIDPADAGGQFCDRGPQYTTAIYYAGDSQRRAANDFMMLLDADRGLVLDAQGRETAPATVVTRAGPFYAAETWHQVYYQKNPLRYRFYSSRCGRDVRLEQRAAQQEERPR